MDPFRSDDERALWRAVYVSSFDNCRTAQLSASMEGQSAESAGALLVSARRLAEEDADAAVEAFRAREGDSKRYIWVDTTQGPMRLDVSRLKGVQIKQDVQANQPTAVDEGGMRKENASDE